MGDEVEAGILVVRCKPQSGNCDDDEERDEFSGSENRKGIIVMVFISNCTPQMPLTVACSSWLVLAHSPLLVLAGLPWTVLAGSPQLR